MTMFLAGGFPMLFVSLFGAIAIGSAARFALRPSEGGHRPIAAYGLAVLLVSAAGAAFDAATVARNVAVREDFQAELPLVVVIGLGESMSPLILGCALAGAAALLVAIGLRRLAT